MGGSRTVCLATPNAHAERRPSLLPHRVGLASRMHKDFGKTLVRAYLTMKELRMGRAWREKHESHSCSVGTHAVCTLPDTASVFGVPGSADLVRRRGARPERQPVNKFN